RTTSTRCPDLSRNSAPAAPHPASRAVLPTLIAASVGYALTNAMIGPILVEVARGFHVSIGVAGQARAVLSGAGAVTAFIATFFADRIPRRRQLLLALGAIAAAETALGL